MKISTYLNKIGLMLAMSELSTLAVDKKELIDVPLLFDAEGEPESGLKVLGADSDEYQEVDRAYRLAGVKKAARRGRGIDAKTDTGAAELVGVLTTREDAIISACAKVIYGFTDGQKKDENGEFIFETVMKPKLDADKQPVLENGEPVMEPVRMPVMIPAELNDATLKRLFKAKPTWRGKVLAAIETDQVFIKASSGAGVL